MFIPVNEPLLDGREKEYLAECIDSGWISSEGPFVEKLEDAFSSYHSKQHGIAVANGSGALDIAIAALEIGEQDEVIMPSFTIISCAASVVRAGARPVLVDSLSDTWNMDVSQVEAKISDRTKAIMVVHLYGLPVDMDPITDIARKYNLPIIEDAAEAIGLEYKGKRCGSFGDISSFSFYPNKHITSGEGGMVLTDDSGLAERCRSLRNLCFQRQKRFVHEELGWNYRMSNLQAAVGLAQFERLNDHLAKKREIGLAYHNALHDLSSVTLPPVSTAYADNLYWIFGLLVNDEAAQKIMQTLAENNIGTRPFFWPMHRQPVFNKMGMFVDEHYPVAEFLGAHGFYLPSGLGLSKEQQSKVIKVVRSIL